MPVADSLTAAPGALAVPNWPASPPRLRRLPASPRRSAVEASASGAGGCRIAGQRRAASGSCSATPPRSIRRPRALLALADWIAHATGARVGYLGEAANSVGAQLVGALPGAGGCDAKAMLDGSLKALLLLNIEPLLDIDDAPAAIAGNRAAPIWSSR